MVDNEKIEAYFLTGWICIHINLKLQKHLSVFICRSEFWLVVLFYLKLNFYFNKIVF